MEERARVASLFLLLFGLVAHLLHVVDALLGVETRAGFKLGILDRLAGSLEEPTLLELELTFNLLALDVGDEEGRNQVLDDNLGLVALLLDLIEEVVDLANLELGFVVGLEGGSVVNGLHDHRLEV